MLFLLLASTGIKAQGIDSAEKAARQYIQLFAANQYTQLAARLDSTMRRKMDQETLGSIWDDLVASHGEFEQALETKVSSIKGYYKTVTTLKFQKRKIGFQLTLNNTLEISGIFLVPLAEKHNIAAYVKTEQFYEIKIPVNSGNYATEGVLSIPKAKEKVPVVIIVHGSGTIDKDCSIGPNKIYKDLAWGLAAKGIAVFRYDKRTFLHLQQMLADDKSGKQPFDVSNEYLADIKKILSSLKKRKEIDPKQMYILGHSEGGYLIPLFNQQFKHLAGFISMAGTLRQIPELAMEQMAYLKPDSLDSKAEQQIALLTRMASNSLAENINKATPNDSVLAPFTTNYWLYLKGYQPPQLALKINVPLLVLQGERDYQVKMKDFNLWKSTFNNKTTVAYKSYPALNHLFLEGEGPSKPAEYNTPSNVPEYVIDDIVGWLIKSRLPK